MLSNLEQFLQYQLKKTKTGGNIIVILNLVQILNLVASAVQKGQLLSFVVS